jgi:hypothetical protein
MGGWSHERPNYRPRSRCLFLDANLIPVVREAPSLKFRALDDSPQPPFAPPSPRAGFQVLLTWAVLPRARESSETRSAIRHPSLNLLLLSRISKMPDLNSVPPSPHALASVERRAVAQQMGPPPVPSSSSSASANILPSNQSIVNNAGSSSSLPSPHFIPLSGLAGDNTGVGPGPGPIRHPRPLTAADLHLELEKEQEAVVSPINAPSRQNVSN